MHYLYHLFQIVFMIIINDSRGEVFYDYYWRNYKGEIPFDAVPGGLDVNGKVTYIGQVYLEKFGILPVTIYPGNKTVVANIQGIWPTDKYVKILCSYSRDHFSWYQANSTHLHLTMAHKHLVVVGVEYGLETNLGRITYQGELIIGKVCSFNVGNALLYFAKGGRQIEAKSYEILVYEDPKTAFCRRP